MAKRPTSSSKSTSKAGKKPVVRDVGFLGADDEADDAPVMSRSMHPAPIPLSHVLGQPRAVAALQSAMRSERLHHAWIFYGPEGVGKFTTALAFAAILLDPTTAPTLSGWLEPDPQSQVQRLVRAGTHPDLHVITKELALFSEDAKVRAGKQITIAKDVVEQELIRRAALAPAMRTGSRVSKVFIVDEAELLDRSISHAPVQSSLLKTLEEPPEGTVIILVTSSEEKLLPTIRSRSQRVAFGPLSADAMLAWSRSAAPDVAGEERAWLMEFASGSPGAFERAHHGKLFAWHTALAPMLAKADQGKYEIALAPTMAKLVDEWAQAWVDSHVNASKEAANHAGAQWLFRLLAEHYRGLLRKAAMSGRMSGGPGQATDQATHVAQRAADALDILEEAQRRLNANIGSVLVMEGAVANIVGVFSGEAIG